MVSPVPVIQHEQNAQEAQYPAVSPKSAPGDRSLAFASTLKQPSVSNRSRMTGGKNRRFLLISAVLCLTILVMVGGFYVWSRVKALPPSVTVYQVGVQNVTQDIGGGGIVYPLQEEDISYPIAERALAVLVGPGDHVTANQPLIRLDMAQLNAQINQAGSDIISAAAYLNAVRATGIAVNIAQAQQVYDNAKNKHDELVAEASSSTLHNGTVISPISGVVTSLYIAAGEIFASNKTMIVIMDESTVIVHADLPLSYLEQVHLDQPATVIPSALPDLSFQGKISAIIPQANSQTDTFQAWIAVANPKQELLPGMSAFVHIQNSLKALGLPRLAVLNPDREGVVFVVRNRHAYLQKVQIVGHSVEKVFIDGGISTGDVIVLIGLNNLEDGQEVRVTGVEV